MKIVTIAQMRSLERAAMLAGLSEQDLMMAAGKGIADILSTEFPNAEEFYFFCGKGHNGGDGIIAARCLIELGFRARCFSCYSLSDPLVEPLENYVPQSHPQKIRVDALLGIGARSDLDADLRKVSENYLQSGVSPIVAIDLPSGLNADTGECGPATVIAHLTITIGAPKIGLFTREAQEYVGRLYIVPLPIPEEATERLQTPWDYFQIEEARPLLPHRPWNAHKGICGHVCVIAGNVGTAGAAALAIEGALLSGAGLVTALVPKSIYPMIASQIKEALIRPFERLDDCHQMIPEKATLVMGPGMGVTEEGRNLLVQALVDHNRSLVLDADALNMLVSGNALLELLRPNILLTPHPGEMKRLMSQRDMPRLDAVENFISYHSPAVVLKGACTIAGQRGKPLSINSTGNPGMATGGMGDVLAGLCGGLMAQGLNAYDTGRLGTFIHGLAGDLSLAQESYESLLPRHLSSHLGSAFRLVHGN